MKISKKARGKSRPIARGFVPKGYYTYRKWINVPGEARYIDVIRPIESLPDLIIEAEAERRND